MVWRDRLSNQRLIRANAQFQANKASASVQKGTKMSKLDSATYILYIASKTALLISENKYIHEYIKIQGTQHWMCGCFSHS